MRLLMCFEELITEIGQIKNMVCSLEKPHALQVLDSKQYLPQLNQWFTNKSFQVGFYQLSMLHTRDVMSYVDLHRCKYEDWKIVCTVCSYDNINKKELKGLTITRKMKWPNFWNKKQFLG